MDASTDRHDILPVSPDELLARLDGWNIRYRLYRHPPLRTVEDSRAAEHLIGEPGETPLRIKNLYLRDKKKQNHLVTLEQNREIDLKALAAGLGGGNLSFGSPDRLFEHLGIRPGAVSPLAMVNGVGTGVAFHLDRAACAAETICMHPLVNDRSVIMARDELFAFLEHIGCAINWLD